MLSSQFRNKTKTDGGVKAAVKNAFDYSDVDVCTSSAVKSSHVTFIYIVLYLGCKKIWIHVSHHDIWFGGTVLILKNGISIFKKIYNYRTHGSCFVFSSYPDR